MPDFPAFTEADTDSMAYALLAAQFDCTFREAEKLAKSDQLQWAILRRMGAALAHFGYLPSVRSGAD